ncbi:MAG: hypothetical protein GXX87_01570 [Euryarchaeota archaeon]|nr:hypothetical protein [Euryarchaeota archaeon]
MTVIGILLFLAGLFFLIIGAHLLLTSASVGGLDLIGISGVIVGAIYLVIGYGTLRGWKVIWYVAVILSAITAAAFIISFILPYTGFELPQEIAGLATGGIVSFIVNLIILFYLFRPGVKEFFDI